MQIELYSKSTDMLIYIVVLAHHTDGRGSHTWLARCELPHNKPTMKYSAKLTQKEEKSTSCNAWLMAYPSIVLVNCCDQPLRVYGHNIFVRTVLTVLILPFLGVLKLTISMCAPHKQHVTESVEREKKERREERGELQPRHHSRLGAISTVWRCEIQ